MELGEESFDSSVLTLFRSRLLSEGKEQLLLNKLLERCQQLKLLENKGKARTEALRASDDLRSASRSSD